jgi:hypothetical protein
MSNTTTVTDGTTSSQTLGYNSANEIAPGSGVTYDANGNTTADGSGNQFFYDAWNRLVKVENSGGSTLETMTYDGLNRKVTDSVTGGSDTALYYSSAWQVLEERSIGAGGMIATTASTQYTWSPLYVNDMICRDTLGTGGIVADRIYAMHDANWNVTGTVQGAQGAGISGNPAAGAVIERYAYDPYGQFTILNAANWTVVSTTLDNSAASVVGWRHFSQGEEYDAISCTEDAENRVTSLVLSRDLQQDPAQQGTDWYLDRGDNPVDRVDPTGLWTYEGMLTKYLEKYGDDGLKLLQYAVVQGYTIEKKSFKYHKWEYDDGAKVLGLADHWGWIGNDDSDDMAAKMLHGALDEKFSSALGNIIKGMASIYGASIKMASEMGLFGEGENPWLKIEADAAEAGTYFQGEFQDEALWTLGAIVGAKDAQLAIKGLKAAIEARKAIKVAEAVSDIASADANKLNHIFGQSKHGLDAVVQQMGSQEAAYKALQEATEAAVKKNNLTGLFTTTVNVGGETITVKGIVVKGAVKIGTAFK